MEPNTQRLPKSLKHWAGKSGFYAFSRRQWRRDGYFVAASAKAEHIKGCRSKSRVIRVLPHLDRMDICDGYFDRWANSMGASTPMPKTEAEFTAALATLLKKSRGRVRATQENTADA